MKKFGLFLLKNNVQWMTFCFLGWLIWAACNWNNLELAQKITLGIYAFLIAHEYEEGYKDRFLELMAGRLLKINYKALTPGLTHLSQAIYITTIFSLALLFPAQLWLTFGVIILAIFEGYVHNMGIFLFRLRGLSPGWWTAMGMAAFAIWGLVEINQAYDYTGIQWLWATLYYIATFIAMEIGFQKLIKNSFSNTIHSARSFLSERFGTKQ